ncbi:butyrophilin subfamily 3 member A1-like isoform X2 [Hoplias malabaricus]|uniref:butyrophilin subfamily 3 member A1-like isoform X2 n=1 Tax=Hoplias malabaricus TaxID=27720 RepID=UPI003461DE60
MKFLVVTALILSVCKETRAEQFIVVCPDTPIVGEAGEDLVLPCSIQPRDNAESMTVEWIRLELTQADTIVHLYEGYEDMNDRQMESYRGRTSLFKEELRKGNTSLKLSAVRASDEGLYQCYVEDTSKSWFEKNTLHVKVKGRVYHFWKIAIICVSVAVIVLAVFTVWMAKDRCSNKQLSPAECSAIAYLRLHSDNRRKELNLKKYNTSDKGYQRLIPAISNCRTARLAGCNLSEQSITTLAAALQSVNCSLRELDLSKNDLRDSGVEKISAALYSPHCKLEALRLVICNLSVMSCEYLLSALQSETCCLRELDLTHNGLQDSGVEKLCDALNSSHCKLEILRLSGCLITMEGCSSLASALKSNPIYLRELDLTYNHPGESGEKLLIDTHCSLQTLRMENSGQKWIKSSLTKYACDLTLDPNTAHTTLSLSAGNRKVDCVEENLLYSDHPERFDYWAQVLSVESFSGRCYWEVEWSGGVYISVSYRGIRRKGGGAECRFGRNKNSWSLICSGNSFSLFHNNQETKIPAPPFPSKKVGVYLDWEEGTLSFYTIPPNKHTLTHLHTLTATFTEPLHTGFWVWGGSSVQVCEVE